MLTPKRPRPVTIIPAAEPLLKATNNPSFSPFFAPSAVLTLAMVAILMLILPDKALNKDPKTKDTAIDHPRNEKNNNVAIIIKMIKTLYSLFKNAMAPL